MTAHGARARIYLNALAHTPWVTRVRPDGDLELCFYNAQGREVILRIHPEAYVALGDHITHLSQEAPCA